MQLNNVQPACFQLWQATFVEMKVQHVSRNSRFAGNRRPFTKKTRHATHCARVALYRWLVAWTVFFHNALPRVVPQIILLTFRYDSKHNATTDLIHIISKLLYLSVWNLSSNLILQCLWLKACGGLKGLSCDLIVEISQVLYYSVSSKDHTTFCKFFWLDNFAKDGVSTYPADLPVRI